STLMHADDGTCRVLGHDVRREPYAIRSRIGFLPDVFDLPAVLTLREYLGIFTELYGISRGDRGRRVDAALQLTRTEDLSERKLQALSRGEVQRVGLARALIHNPEILILDEPAAGLDPHARVELKELLRLLRERGGSRSSSQKESMCARSARCDQRSNRSSRRPSKKKRQKRWRHDRDSPLRVSQEPARQLPHRIHPHTGHVSGRCVERSHARKR